jgi:hypothetical protein
MSKLKQEVLGRTNLSTLPMTMVAIVMLSKEMLCKHNNPTIKQSQTIAVQG